MAILGRAKASTAEPPPPAPGKCDACKATDTELTNIGKDVTICVHEAPCIARAKTAGIWLEA